MDRGAYPLASDRATQAQLAHQPLNGAAGHGHVIALDLAPDLLGAIDLQVGVPDALDLGRQDGVTASPGATERRVALLRRIPPVARWSDLQRFADRLDSVGVAMRVNERSHDLSRRSSSACAKNALANLRISLALRSSRTSRSRSLMRCCSVVVSPSR